VSKRLSKLEDCSFSLKYGLVWDNMLGWWDYELWHLGVIVTQHGEVLGCLCIYLTSIVVVLFCLVEPVLGLSFRKDLDIEGNFLVD
jgi:hypothetical protein